MRYGRHIFIWWLVLALSACVGGYNKQHLSKDVVSDADATDADGFGEPDADATDADGFGETDGGPTDADGFGEPDADATDADSHGEPDADATDADSHGETDGGPTDADGFGETDGGPTDADGFGETDGGPTDADDFGGQDGGFSDEGSDTSGDSTGSLIDQLWPLQNPADMAVSLKANLRWKRVDILKNDLSQALGFAPAESCKELEIYDCFLAHKIPLGGSDPFGSGLYEPARSPQITTPIAVERIIMNTCIRRTLVDAAGPAVVFTELDLTSPGLDPSDPETVHAVDNQIRILYRRFLARNPTVEEKDLIRSLLHSDTAELISASDFAILSCFAVGSTTEFIFF